MRPVIFEGYEILAVDLSVFFLLLHKLKETLRLPVGGRNGTVFATLKKKELGCPESTIECGEREREGSEYR